MAEVSLKSYSSIKPKYELVKWKKNNDEVCLISCPTDRNGNDIRINSSGFDILKLMSGEISLQEIATLLQEEYSAEAGELEGKVKAFVTTMTSMGIVENLATPEKRKKEPIVINSDYWLKKLQIEITSRCNLRCRHCYFYEKESSNRMPELPISKVTEVIGEAKRMGVEAVSLTGGEPFMREDIFDILTYIESMNMAIIVLSNGTLIDQEVARRLSAIKNVYITISLDGPKEAHERLRGVKGCFDKTVGGIENLLSVGIRPQINLTLNRELLGKSSQAITLLKELGYEKPPRLGVTMNLGRAQDNAESISVAEFAAEFAEYWKAVKEVFDFEKYPVKVLKGHNCGVGDDSLVITSEGNIVPCPPLNREPFILGNVYRDRILDVWNRSKMLEKIRNIDTRRNKKCGFCKHWEYCKGGCRISAMISVAGSMDSFFGSPNPYACARWATLEDDIKIIKEGSDEISLSQLL